MRGLTTEQALKIIANARKHAAKIKAKPVAIAVVDDGGHVLALARHERAGFARADIALNKAWGCLALALPSRTLRNDVKGWETWFAGIQGATGGRLMPVLGGVFARAKDGTALGAVGVAGAAGEVDEALAVHGIRSVGLIADTGDA
ncbi:MAG: heme-binding protein [Proteobacteria bacterium]|nr:heme-binding protein [Pseudomonadota bacterium]